MRLSGPDNSMQNNAWRVEDMRAYEDAVRVAERLTPLGWMERAGAEVAQRVLAHAPDAQHVTVLCGEGHCGGTGWVAARRMRVARPDLNVQCLQVGAPNATAEQACTVARSEVGLKPTPWHDAGQFEGTDLILDALVGVGLEGELRWPYDTIVQASNAYRERTSIPVMSVDIPSGVVADTGAVLGDAVHADVVVSMAMLKPGLLTGEGRGYVHGPVWVAPLSAKQPAQAPSMPPVLRVAEVSAIPVLRPKPPSVCHKGMRGHVLVVGGDAGMVGAGLLAALGALHVGAGQVSVALPTSEHATVVQANPCFMTVDVEDRTAMQRCLARVDVVVLGCGTLPGSRRVRRVLRWLRRMQQPPCIVVDAGALEAWTPEDARRMRSVLTPHPGEIGRLLGCDATTIQRDRLGALHQGLKRFHGRAGIVLKGAGSLVGGPACHVPWCCMEGHPVLATAGSGDVLSGMVAGCWAQCGPTFWERATVLATVWHGLAGRLAHASHGGFGVTPDQWVRVLPQYADAATSAESGRPLR